MTPRGLSHVMLAAVTGQRRVVEPRCPAKGAGPALERVAPTFTARQDMGPLVRIPARPPAGRVGRPRRADRRRLLRFPRDPSYSASMPHVSGAASDLCECSRRHRMARLAWALR